MNPSDPMATPLQTEVEDRFGVLPNFFRLAPEAPEVTANLWGYAKFAYLDNPLPSLFKERLFVFFSRFCEVRYCITRHVGFLAGLGRPSGDRRCPPETVEQVIRLIRRRFPQGDDLDPYLVLLESAPLSELPESDTQTEEAVFACATHVFLETPQAGRCLEALRGSLDAATLQHLLVFLSFVRTAHFWTKVHPELKFEDDVTELLAVHEALAECVRHDPEAAACETGQGLLNELVILREEREQAELLRVTLASIGDAVVTTDTHGRITNMNPVAETLTGWTRTDARGQPLDEVFRIVNEDSRQPVESPAAKALKGDIVGLANHTVLLARDGRERAIDDSAAPIRNEQGRIVGCVLVFRDVTERRTAERELRQARSRLASTLTASEIGTWEFDVDRDKVWADPNLARMFGVTPEEAAGGPLEAYSRAIHPEDRSWVAEAIRQAVEAEESFDTEYRIVGPDGAIHWVVARGRVERDGVDGTVRLPGVVMDITARRRAEADLRTSEEGRRQALDSAGLGAWNIDPSTNLLTSDERFRLIFHGSADPITYEEAFAAIHPDDRERIRAAVAAATQPDDPAPYAEEYRVIHPNGSVLWVLGQGRANFEQVEGERRLVSFDGTVMDISDRKAAEEERERLVGQLRDQDKRKDEFLATLAHELRNPLAPLRTGLQVMKKANQDDKTVSQAREMMDRQLGQMVRLIDDLMDVSRISRGKIELRMQRVELNEVVRSAVEAAQPQSEEMGHELTVTLPTEPVVLEADLTRLAQVFLNLLTNAAKYTDRGGRILLEARRKEGNVLVSVKDTGIGIAADQLAGIFEMFSQVGGAAPRSQGGLGIGLTLVRRLVEMHGGSVEAFSDGPGKGSEFVVRLPIVEGSSLQEAGEESGADPESALRILIVDDNRDSADSLSMLLQLTGNDTRTAYDGEEAVATAEEFQPDVILLDIGLPKVDGYEACRRIRRGSVSKSTFIIAQTGWGADDDRRRAQEAGFDHHLVKPVDPDALMDLLAGLSKLPTR